MAGSGKPIRETGSASWAGRREEETGLASLSSRI